MVRGGLARHSLNDESAAFPRASRSRGCIDAVQWARKYSFFSYPFVTACCGMEYFSVAGPRYDIDRFGAALPRFTPRQADLLFVVGTITQRQAPILRRVWEQMAEPKWVVSFGACTSSGGPYDNYAVLQGIDRIIPVDIYIPGCPPRPEAVLDGLIKLQYRVQNERQASTVVQSPWQRTQARLTPPRPTPLALRRPRSSRSTAARSKRPRARRCCRRCSMRESTSRTTATIPSSASTAVAACARSRSRGCRSCRSPATPRCATGWSCIRRTPRSRWRAAACSSCC